MFHFFMIAPLSFWCHRFSWLINSRDLGWVVYYFTARNGIFAHQLFFWRLLESKGPHRNVTTTTRKRNPGYGDSYTTHIKNRENDENHWIFEVLKTQLWYYNMITCFHGLVQSQIYFYILLVSKMIVSWLLAMISLVGYMISWRFTWCDIILHNY